MLLKFAYHDFLEDRRFNNVTDATIITLQNSRKGQYIKNDIIYFQKILNFDSLKSFNNNLEMHLVDNEFEFSDKNIVVL